MASVSGRAMSGLIGIGVLAAIGIGVLALSDRLMGGNADALEEAPPLSVEVQTVTILDRYERQRLFPGRIEAAQVADLSFQVGGELETLSVSIGDQIERGDLVAALDPTRLRLRVREAEAAIREAQAELTRSGASLQRTRGLFNDGFATAQDVDDALAARDSAQERVTRLNRGLELAREDLTDTRLVAPFSGAVVARYIDPGTNINSGEPVVRVNQSGVLEAKVGVPTDLAATIEIGQAFDLRLNGKRVSANVSGIGDDVDEATQSVTVRLSIYETSNTEVARLLVPGSLVRLVLAEERFGRGAWVPLSAIAESYRGLWSVFVVEDEAGTPRIRRKDVTIVAAAEERVYVDGTIDEGDRVVTSAPFRFVPGQAVEVTRTTTMQDRLFRVSEATP